MSKQKHNPTRRPRLMLRDRPFAQLVVSVQELMEVRREYAGRSPEERRSRAQWAYDSGMADEFLSRALLGAGRGADFDSGYDSGVVALAIDPRFAPALLTVGSIEYQYKRPDAAMELFMTLTTLPQTEPDLAEIIDKAGRLSSACTCPYGIACKHAVAMVLACLHAVQTGQLIPASDEDDERLERLSEAEDDDDLDGDDGDEDDESEEDDDANSGVVSRKRVASKRIRSDDPDAAIAAIWRVSPRRPSWISSGNWRTTSLMCVNGSPTARSCSRAMWRNSSPIRAARSQTCPPIRVGPGIGRTNATFPTTRASRSGWKPCWHQATRTRLWRWATRFCGGASNRSRCPTTLGLWDTVRPMLLRWIETGSRPDQVPAEESARRGKAKGAPPEATRKSAWPLPATGLLVPGEKDRYRSFPEIATLIAVAIRESEMTMFSCGTNKAERAAVTGRTVRARLWPMPFRGRIPTKPWPFGCALPKHRSR